MLIWSVRLLEKAPSPAASRVFNVLNKALGMEGGAVASRPRLDRKKNAVRGAKYGLTGFERDDRLFVEEDGIKAEVRIQEKRRRDTIDSDKREFVDRLVRQTLGVGSPDRAATPTRRDGRQYRMVDDLDAPYTDTPPYPSTEWPAELQAAAMLDTFSNRTVK